LPGGPGGFARDFSGPVLLGILSRAVPCISSTGPTPSAARHSNLFDYARTHTPTVRQNGHGKSRNPGHATPAGYHTWHGLAFVRVRSPLLTESLLFSLPAGTEMFHFPAFPPHTLCVQAAVTAHDMRRGFPIRTSWDHGPVIDSPRLIADSHVLHRLPMPRHPPCALKNLTTNDQAIKGLPCFKMLASTMQFSNNNPAAPPAPAKTAREHGHAREPNETTSRTHRETPHARSCCLRTQQCAMGPDPVPRVPFQPDRPAYWEHPGQGHRSVIR
jgi:hypothetical protein